MNIDKEREAFEAIFGKNGCEYYPEYNAYQNGNDRNEDAINGKWYAWQAAKKQAIPEGFVLVEKTKLMQIIGSAAIIEPITRGNPLMSKYKTELDFILSTVRAMIEAQEQSHENG